MGLAVIINKKLNATYLNWTSGFAVSKLKSVYQPPLKLSYHPLVELDFNKFQLDLQEKTKCKQRTANRTLPVELTPAS